MEAFLDKTEMDYLTHIVILMYERMDKHIDDEERFRIELLFSPGTVANIENAQVRLQLGASQKLRGVALRS